MNREEKLNVLGKVQRMFGVQDDQLGELPDYIAKTVQMASAAPVVVTFAFNPANGKIVQIALSAVPNKPEVYNVLSQVTTQVAQQFSNLALEAAKNVGEKDRVGEDTRPHRDDEHGTGECPEGPK